MYGPATETDYQLLFLFLVLVQILIGLALDARREQCLDVVMKLKRCAMMLLRRA